MEKTILIVEDEKPLLKTLAKKFESEGDFKVLEAKNGQKGLSAAIKNHPNIILLDILMPKMDGMAMAEELRKDNWGKTVPIIFLSNINPNVKVLTQLIKSKASYYLIKAKSSLNDIVDKVRELVDEK